MHPNFTYYGKADKSFDSELQVSK